MATWVPVHQTIANHPKTRRLRRVLSISIPEAVGIVILTQHWAIDYAPSGDLTTCDAADLADGIHWAGDPDELLAALKGAGFIRCGQCDRSLGVQNTPKKRPGTAATYRECATPGCQRATIPVSVIDAAVWARVTDILRRPNLIAEQLATHRTDGGLDRDLAALDKQLESIVTKQTTLARRVAMLSDDAAEPLMAQLELLATSKRTREADRDALLRRIADEEADRA